jgi:two-component system response regulator AtoC
MARVLLIDDEATWERVSAALRPAGHEVVHAQSAEQALRAFEERAFHVLITELSIPPSDFDGLALLRKVTAARPNLATLVLTAHGTVESAVEAMKLGAVEFMKKPLDKPEALARAVTAAAERYKLRSRVEKTTMSEALNAPQLTFGAPSMKPVVAALKKVALTNATVLLLGESGTGKEVSARAIHFWSARQKAPFVAINCAALTESLLESELFGYERGAFSGADKRRIGRIEQAQGGSFFLDEVGELKPESQAKLLRVIQERRVERLGGSESISVDVRWIAATNRDLESAMAKGLFREDLFHRLAVFPVLLPPLRERREDIVPLAERLLFAIACELGRLGLALDESAKAFLRSSDWPGNVRELRNALERAAIVTDGTSISGATLSADPFHSRAEGLSSSSARARGAAASLDRESAPPALASKQVAPRDAAPRDAASREGAKTLQEAEREAIARALAENGGHRKKTAEALGISLRALYDKLKRYDLS